MNKQLIDSLDECIKLRKAGYSVEYCLSKFPEHSSELIKLLQTAEFVTELRVENVPEESREKSRLNILAKIKRDVEIGQQQGKPSLWNSLLRPFERVGGAFSNIRPVASRLAMAFGVACVLIVVSGGLLITSAKSLPGDSLYPVKLAVEDIRIRLAYNPNTRHAYEDTYTLQRVSEVRRLLKLARIQAISFRGIVNTISETRWDISSVPVIVQADTMIVGGMGGTKLIKPGMTVEVEGTTRSDGWVIADEIHIQEYTFIGAVEKISNKYWMISGIRLLIPSNADIDREIKVGDDVQVYVHSEDSGLYALSVQRVIHLTQTPTNYPTIVSSLVSPEDYYSERLVENITSGILEQINSNYWIIDGQIFYIIYNTKLYSDIKIGDEVSVKYVVEYNGSYTALEIENEHQENNGNGEVKETSESATDDYAEQDATVEPTELEEQEENTPTAVSTGEDDPDETPKPSETPKPTETPEPTDD